MEHGCAPCSVATAAVSPDTLSEMQILRIHHKVGLSVVKWDSAICALTTPLPCDGDLTKVKNLV